MTEIQQWESPAPVATIDLQDKAVRRLTEWAQSAQAAHAVACELVKTTFVPDGFKGKPGEATAAILAGLEVWLHPMVALRSFDVIQGQAAPRAITLRAIVQSFGHEMVMEESTATRCRMRGRRKGTSEWVPVTWTIDRAKDLGLTSKHNWKAQPQAMLVARATSELARLIAADAILGLGYSAEEVADGGPVEQRTAGETVDATPTTTRRMSRPTRQQPAQEQPAERPADDVQDAEEVHDDAPTETATRAMFASFREAGFTDDARSEGGRAKRLGYISQIIGREVASSKDMTAAEVFHVIDALKADAQDVQWAQEAGQ